MKKTIVLATVAVLAIGISLWGQSITVTSPVAGDKWCLGSGHTITWTSSGVSGALSIKLRPADQPMSDPVLEIVANTANDGSYSWSIPASGLAAGDYEVRVRTVATPIIYGDSANFKVCGASSLHPNIQVRPLRPNPQFTKAEQPPLDILRVPRLQVRDLQYNYREKYVEAWVKNIGNAPFVGHFRWQWITDCGTSEANKDIPPEQSALLETTSGMHLSFHCSPQPGACSFHASFLIEPIGQDGTRYESSWAQKDFPAFEHSQFLMSDRRILVRFLHGQHWVNGSSEYVITRDDAYDYDPATKMATFFVGFPVRNCGNEAGKVDHVQSQKLYWSVYHSPSNTTAVYANSVSIGASYSSVPLEPGQGVLVERALTLKVQSGIYMLHVRAGSSASGMQFCVIALRFADDLVH